MRGPTRDLPTFIIALAICCSNKQVVGALNPWRYIFASTKYRDRDRRRRLLRSIKRRAGDLFATIAIKEEKYSSRKNVLTKLHTRITDLSNEITFL